MRSLSGPIKVLFILIIIFFIAQALYVHLVLKSDFNIVGLETANRADGGMLLYTWWTKGNNGIVVIRQAWINTIVDFLFIFAYVGLIRIISRNLLQPETSFALNKLLRFNMRLAIVIGVLDILENIILLYNLTNYYPGEYYVSSMYPGLLKWFLLVWVIVVWIMAIVRRKLKSR